MNIDQYAFKDNRDEIIEANKKRLKEIKHLKPELEIHETPEYKRTSFRGTINKDSEEAMALSESDIFLLVTDGHQPFGGFCEKKGSTFTGARYDD